MGCWFSKSATKVKTNSDESKTFSWDKKEKVNPKDFTIENVKNDQAIRKPNTVNGQQFIIQNCEGSDIFIMDHINMATVDDCVSCNIFLGPTKGSVFVRNCQGCNIMVACQQFRARDCHSLNVFLCCSTQPIIESCSTITFGCFSFHYSELEDQFKQANLSYFTNHWTSVYDFTPVPGEQNWTLLSKEGANDKFTPNLEGLQVSTESNTSLVPQTHMMPHPEQTSCLVLMFYDGLSQERAKAFIKEMKSKASSELVKSFELKIENYDAERIFGSDSFVAVCKTGPVIGLIYSGENCLEDCQEIAKNISKETGSTGLVYVSFNDKTARKQITHINTLTELQMKL